MPYLERSGDVHVLYLGDKDGPENNENRFHPDWIDAVHALLDEVEAVEGPAALVTSRLPRQTAVEAMTTGRRFGGSDAVAAGIADTAVEADQLLPSAIERAAALTSTRGKNLAGIKRGIHADVLDALDTPTGESNFSFGSE